MRPLLLASTLLLAACGPDLAMAAPQPDEAEATSELESSGLTDFEAAWVLTMHLHALTRCAEDAVRWNPGLSERRLELELHVDPDGQVEDVMAFPAEQAHGAWGRCMVGVGKTMRFPAAQGATAIRAPFVIADGV